MGMRSNRKWVKAKSEKRRCDNPPRGGIIEPENDKKLYNIPTKRVNTFAAASGGGHVGRPAPAGPEDSVVVNLGL
jgi:hypothetical protein